MIVGSTPNAKNAPIGAHPQACPGGAATGAIFAAPTHQSAGPSPGMGTTEGPTGTLFCTARLPKRNLEPSAVYANNADTTSLKKPKNACPGGVSVITPKKIWMPTPMPTRRQLIDLRPLDIANAIPTITSSPKPLRIRLGQSTTVAWVRAFSRLACARPVEAVSASWPRATELHRSASRMRRNE